MDIEPYGRFPEQYRPVLYCDFRLVVVGRFSFVQENFLVALAVLIGYRVPELEFCSVRIGLELNFVFKAFLVNFVLCRGIGEFDFFHFVVHVEQQQGKLSVLQVRAHLLYANPDDIAVVDFRIGDLYIVQERETVFGEALDAPFGAGRGLDAFYDGMFSRHEPFGEVEVASFLSPYGKGPVLARRDDMEHGAYPRSDFTPRSKRSQAFASDSSLAA